MPGWLRTFTDCRTICQVWAVALACVALAACAGIALVGSGSESRELLQRRVVYKQQPRIEGLPVAMATPLEPAHPMAARRTRQVMRAGGAGPNAPKQMNAPRIPPKTGAFDRECLCLCLWSVSMYLCVNMSVSVAISLCFCLCVRLCVFHQCV